MGGGRSFGHSVSARVLKALGMFGSVQIVNILCSVVRTKLLSVWVGPVGVGLNALFDNTSELVSSSTQLNLRQSSVRDISATEDEQGRLLIAAVVLRWGLWLGLAGVAAMVMLAPVFSYVSFGNQDYTGQFVLLSTLIVALGLANAYMAVMQGFGLLKELARGRLVSGVVATSLAIPAYWLWGLAAIVPVLMIYKFTIMAVYRYEMRSLIPRLPRPTLSQAFTLGRGFLKFGAYITFANLFMVVIQYIFSVYLNRTVSTEELGVYQAGNTLVSSYIGFIFTAVSLEYYPRLAARVKSLWRMSVTVNHEVVLLMWVIVPMLVVFECCSDFFVRLLYSSRFEAVVPYVAIAVVGAVFRGVSVCFSFALLARGDGRAYVIVEGVSCLFGLTANIVAYELFGFVGLGVAYLVWYAFYATMTAVVCRRRYGMTVNAVTVRLSIAAAAVVAAAAAMKAIAGWCLPTIAILPWLIPLSLRRLRKISG